MSKDARGTQNIKKRLDELHKWQEEQQKIIDERQAEQRIKLGVEQKELYNQLGIFPLEANTKDNDGRNKENHNLEDIPKRSFLKRGQGLKSRFKIDPEALRLHNLPKYKYANSFKKNKVISNVLENKQKYKNYPGKGGMMNKSKPKKVKSKLISVTEKVLRDEDESFCESYSANQEFKYVDLSTKEENRDIFEDKDLKENLSVKEPITWAKVLNTYQIQPFPIEKLRQNQLDLSISNVQEDDTENLSIFELLERKTQQGSFNINASLVQKWIQEKATALLETSKEVEEEKKIKKMEKLRISPLPCDIENKTFSEESGEESSNSSLTDVKDSDTNDESSERFRSFINTNKVSNQSNKGHVHFCEEVEVNHVNSCEEISPVKSFYKWKITDKECFKDGEDNTDFEKFKANLFSEKVLINEGTSLNDSTLIEQLLSIPLKNDEHRKEIIEKVELLKNRLVELESEIATFRQNNSDLLRLKQEHELDKIQFEHNRLEIEEKFNDEKIKYEIHLHDERLKIEEEKKKLEKINREQKNPNRKEKDEILKLKDEIETLRRELKEKESKHVAAQARLRAQIRILEKEVKDINFEVDNLKKENKKLESENAQMTRQNNNKMLQEINKTIAKLAVKPVAVDAEIVQNKNNKNFKPVVAKVVSHKQKSLCINENSKSRIFRNRSCIKYESSSGDLEGENEFDSSSSEEKTINPRKVKMCQLKNNSKSKKKISDLSDSSQFVCKDNNNYNAQEFKREIEHPDGSKDIWHPNGNLKKISADGMNIKMLYFNKDIKETNISEGTVRYYYAEKNTWHTTYLDGLEILEFPNGQTEHRYKDGKVEVHFPNGSIRISNPSDQYKQDEWKYADGTTCVHLKNGDKILSFPNGQKEIHTKIHKRREYPDGTVKIVYPDGSQETRYSNGRIRLKDKDGNLIMDSEHNKY